MTAEVTEGDLIAHREGGAGIIRLNRPKAINALTLGMVRDMDRALSAFAADPAVSVVLLEGAGERGLCAGGDIRGLYESARANGDLGPVFWREEYILNARIARYPKPYVAYMDGLVMGGGVGLASHGSHRIVNERTKLAMPEVGIGFFPDVGGTWLLSRAPGEVGTYYGLTGEIMTAADAIYAGLADVAIRSEAWSELRAALTALPSVAGGDPVRRTIDRFSDDPRDSVITPHRGRIDALFRHDTLEEIVAALRADGSDFAKATLETMSGKSPTSMKVTLKLLRAARASASLEECLAREYRAALEVFDSKEFAEGVRAAIIDKDRQPKWSPAKIEDVTPDIVARYFNPREGDRLDFPD